MPRGPASRRAGRPTSWRRGSGLAREGPRALQALLRLGALPKAREDLAEVEPGGHVARLQAHRAVGALPRFGELPRLRQRRPLVVPGDRVARPELEGAGVALDRLRERSEGHTSELQSRLPLVC